MNQQQKNNLISKLKSAKETEVLFTSDYDNQSVTRCLTELKKMLTKNPEATIIILR
jgi:replicative DNA helicase